MAGLTKLILQTYIIPLGSNVTIELPKGFSIVQISSSHDNLHISAIVDIHEEEMEKYLIYFSEYFEGSPDSSYRLITEFYSFTRGVNYLVYLKKL